MRSLQYGAYGNMLKNIVGSYMGYIQIHNKGFWEEQTLDNSFSIDEISKLDDVDNIKLISHRVEGFALASTGNNSKPVAILGLDAVAEKEQINLSNKVAEGNYLTPDKSEILVGIGLKKIMGLSIGDTLIFVGQGYQGSMASGAYPIGGFIDLKTPELNKRTIVLNLTDAQSLFGLGNMVTTAVIGLQSDKWEPTYNEVLEKVDTNALEVLNWKELVPELNQLITVDKAGGTFVLLILYSIIAFSLFGTVLMLTEERSFEYGVLIAVGMAKNKVIIVALLETIMMAVVGVLAGLVAVFPFLLYFNINPINLDGQKKEIIERFGFEALVPTSLDPSIAFSHGGIIFLIMLAVNGYMVWKIKTMKPIDAMRQ